MVMFASMTKVNPVDESGGCAGRIALTGRLVTKSEALLTKKSYLWIMANGFIGKIFTLGSDITTQREQLKTEQENLGLISALVLTIVFPYMFDLQDVDFSEFSHPNLHEGALLVFSLVSVVGFILSTLHAVLTICFVGELTGDVEPAVFADRMGLMNMASFWYFLVGILSMAVVVFYHFVLFSPNDWPKIVGIPAAVMLALTFLPISFHQQKVIFDTKWESYHTQPKVLTIEQVDDYAVQYCDQIGVAHLDAPSLQRYIELQMPSAGYRMNVLSHGSIAIIGAVAETIQKDYLDTALKNSTSRKRVADSLAVTQVESLPA